MDPVPVRVRKSQYFLSEFICQNPSRIYRTFHCIAAQLNVVTTVELKLFKLYYRSLVLYLYWNVSSRSPGPHFVFIRANMEHPLWPQVSLGFCSNLDSDKLLSALSFRWRCLSVLIEPKVIIV